MSPAGSLSEEQVEKPAYSSMNPGLKVASAVR